MVQSISFEVQSGENVVICGKGGKAAVLLGSCKQLVPVPDKTAVKGTIQLGGVDLQNIGRKRTVHLYTRCLEKGYDDHGVSLPIHGNSQRKYGPKEREE